MRLVCDDSFPHDKRLQTKNLSFNSSLWYEPQKNVLRRHCASVPDASRRANDADMMVQGWNLRECVLRERAVVCIGYMILATEGVWSAIATEHHVPSCLL